MKKIGIIFGMENTFPPALVDKINSMGVEGVSAEFVKVGGIRMDQPKKYDVIIDRISQDISFYRAYLKNAALHGTVVINNPFWWTADDKFFNYAMAEQLGVAIPADRTASAQPASAGNDRPVHAEPDVSAELGRGVRVCGLAGFPEAVRRRGLETCLQAALARRVLQCLQRNGNALHDACSGAWSSRSTSAAT